eukprot:4665726-Prymnesium_polylepis.1
MCLGSHRALYGARSALRVNREAAERAGVRVRRRIGIRLGAWSRYIYSITSTGPVPRAPPAPRAAVRASVWGYAKP